MGTLDVNIVYPLCRKPFLMHTYVQLVSFPDQRPRTLVWDQDWFSTVLV